MADMPRPRPPYLHRQITRHGQVTWYVRKGKGRRVRIRAEYGTPEFAAQYRAAMEGMPIERSGPLQGSLEWLIARYRDSSKWQSLSMATRRQRENIFKHVIASAGKERFAAISKATILAGRERRKDTPAQARNFLDAMRGLFAWAQESDFVKVNPTAGVANPPRPKTGGFPDWDEADVEKYEARWPLGTKERVWLDVLLYTGLRRGDAVRLGRPHVRNNIAKIKTEKSGHTIEVTLPILPVLAASLAAGKVGELTFICGESGKPLTKESFGNMFSEAARAAGVNKSAHGVRKIAATRAANAGATVAQLEAIFGWKGGTMASLYTRKADRERLAIEAIHKLANNSETSIPLTLHKVGGAGEKSK